MKPRLLDLFCGAGGAGEGYARAGWEVVGVDVAPQPRYPYRFVQADALEYLAAGGWRGFDAIHASPPCQAYSTMRRGLWKDRQHVELIAPTREALRATGLPYVIENVEGARKLLLDPIRLCGTGFGLGTSEGNQLRRHRYFEIWPDAPVLVPPCAHNSASAVPIYGGGQNGDYHTPRRRPKTVGVYGSAGGSSTRDGLVQFGTDARREAMGIAWMVGRELSEAIPPAYTEWIGRQMIGAL